MRLQTVLVLVHMHVDMAWGALLRETFIRGGYDRQTGRGTLTLQSAQQAQEPGLPVHPMGP